MGEMSSEEQSTQSSAYHPTDEYDQLEEPGSMGGWGAGRRKNLEAIDNKDRLDDIVSFKSIEEMENAVREMSLAHRDTRIAKGIPQDTVDKLRAVYESLPEDAQREFLNDDVLHRRINAARKAFNRWLGKFKREQQIPSWAEAGPSKYPTKKVQKLQKYEREGKEELDERIEKIKSGASGGKQRALNAVGSSVAEQTAKKEQSDREQLRELIDKGDIIQYRNPRLQVGAVHRVNKKSLRLIRPNPRYPSTKPMSDEPEPEYRKETVDLNPQWLVKIGRDSFDEQLETLREFYEDIPDEYDQAVAYLTGEEDSVTDETEEEPEHHNQELVDELRDEGIDKRAATSLADSFADVDDIVDQTNAQLQDYKWVGPATTQQIRASFDTNVGDDYTIKEQGEGYEIAEWTEPADEDVDIRTGEILLRKLISAEHFGHHAEVRNEITEWASGQSRSSDSVVAEELIEAAFELLPREINFGTLFIEEDFEDGSYSEEQEHKLHWEAVLKARAVMAFCDLNDKKSVLADAQNEAQDEIEKEREAEKEERHQKLEAQKILNYSNDYQTIAGWDRIGMSTHGAKLAYRGWWKDEPHVIALYETSEFVKVRAFPLIEWYDARDAASDSDWADTLDQAFSNPTGKTPDTFEEGAGDLRDWLQSNESEEPEDFPDWNMSSATSVNGWTVTNWIAGGEVVYEDRDQDAAITVDGRSLILEDGFGDKQTVELDDFDEALENAHEFLSNHMSIQGGGTPVEVPRPDDESADDDSDSGSGSGGEQQSTDDPDVEVEVDTATDDDTTATEAIATVDRANPEWELTDMGGENTYAFKHTGGRIITVKRHGEGWDADLQNPAFPRLTKWLTDAEAREDQPGEGPGERARDPVNLDEAIEAANNEMKETPSSITAK